MAATLKEIFSTPGIGDALFDIACGILFFLGYRPIQKLAAWEAKKLPRWLLVFPPEVFEKEIGRWYLQGLGLACFLLAFIELMSIAKEIATGEQVRILPRVFGF
jgi:hypothetical protein